MARVLVCLQGCTCWLQAAAGPGQAWWRLQACAACAAPLWPLPERRGSRTQAGVRIAAVVAGMTLAARGSGMWGAGLAALGLAAGPSAVSDSLLRALPQTFTAGEAWLLACAACHALAWSVHEGGVALRDGTAGSAALHAVRTYPLQALPALVVLATAVFCCSVLGPLQRYLSKRRFEGGSASRGGCDSTSGRVRRHDAGGVDSMADAESRAKPASAVATGRHNGAPSAATCATVGVAAAAYAVLIAAAAWRTVGFALATARRRAVLAAWAAALAASLPAMSAAADLRRVPNVLLRKGFHIVAIALFVPVLVIEPQLLSLALGVALALMVAAEALRAAGLPRVAPFLGSFMDKFTDARDGGAVTVSHMSLLLGIVAPMWLAGVSGERRPPLAAWAGLLTLGVADTAAAAVGSTWGRVRVHRTSRKTIEGTAAAAASLWATLAVVCAARWAGGAAAALCASWRLALLAVLVALLEASTAQLDNFVVPLFACTIAQAMLQ